MVKKKDKIDLTNTVFYKAGRTNGQTRYSSIIINDLLKMNNVLKTWLIVVSILWSITAVWSFTRIATNNALKRENEALKGQIKVCEEQRDRLSNDITTCMEFEEKIDKNCTCNFKEE